MNSEHGNDDVYCQQQSCKFVNVYKFTSWHMHHWDQYCSAIFSLFLFLSQDTDTIITSSEKFYLD